jgi:membrane protein DedA with SNARE-associated domain
MTGLPLDASLNPLVQLAALVLGTFASEDLTCISAGLLIGAQVLDPLIGMGGCFLGIFLGDLGLWLIGLLARLGLAWLVPTKRLVPPTRRQELQHWLETRGALALVAARFLPGARLPLYVASGLFGLPLRTFAFWTFLAALLWVPLLVILTALLGDTIVLEAGWPVVLSIAIALFLAMRIGVLACTATGRGKLIARVSRLWRWEFWPSWLFYLPVLPWLTYLSLRHRGVLTWTAANPGMPHGGIVGESKCEILRHLPPERTLPGHRLAPGDVGTRLHEVKKLLESGWSFPLILKPDAGQRGAGVRRVHNLAEVETYLQENPAAVLTQVYHPGPFEAGIFYYRLPGEAAGHIFSVTDKVFPVLTGDGYSTLEELIWRHPRFRMQAQTFLARHEVSRCRVLADGEDFVLTLAGNHCQGTMFRDGSTLITPELERCVDVIARWFPGFYIGRFDVRYANREAFKAGRDLAIVELNGVTSESTNVYDPSWTLIKAYRTLFRQWALLYRIGSANKQRGCASTGLWELWRLVRDYYRGLRVDPLAD